MIRLRKIHHLILISIKKTVNFIIYDFRNKKFAFKHGNNLKVIIFTSSMILLVSIGLYFYLNTNKEINDEYYSNRTIFFNEPSSELTQKVKKMSFTYNKSSKLYLNGYII